MLQFGGHHLALNITIVGDRGILTPTLTGAQPAMYTLDGKTVRPLGQESDKAQALLNTLDDGQRRQAVIGSRMADLVLGPGQDGRKNPTRRSEGVRHERQAARHAARRHLRVGRHRPRERSRCPYGPAQGRNERHLVRLERPDNGTPGKNISAYYRIQGPHLVIEYAPQGLGGDASNHVHTMYRDPTNDYGFGVTKK